MSDMTYPLVSNAGQTDVPIIGYHDDSDGSFSLKVYSVNGGGGGGGSSLSDVLLTDSNGILFVGRDSGATTGTIFTYYRLDTQAAYTPVGTIKAAGNNVVTIADGADVTQGAIADAAVAAGASGTDSAKIRAISRDMGTVAAATTTSATAALQTAGNTSLAAIATAEADIFVAATNITTQNLTPTTGAGTAGSNVTVVLTGGQSVVNARITANALGAAVSIQVTYDGTNWDNVGSGFTQVTSGPPTIVSANTIATGTTGSYQWNVAGAKGFRLSANAATVSGTLTVSLNASRASAQLVSSVGLTQVGTSQLAVQGSVGGSPYGAPAVIAAAATTVVDYSAVAWTATSGVGATITDYAGAVCSFDINVSALTLGTSTGLDIFLSHSEDGGTTWNRIWQCEAITAVGHVQIPPILIPGARRRMEYVNRTGVATTATTTITTNRHSVAPSTPVRQWFDRTAGVLAGTATNATPWYDVAGCRNVTAWVPMGAAGTPATYQLQFSADASNALPANAAAAGVASGVQTYVNTPGTSARFARVICTTAGATQTAATTPVVITGC